MNDFPLAQSMIGGLLALLGVFFGALLTRQTEYERWLRQERSKIFGELLRELHETRLAAADAYYRRDAGEITKSIEASEEFARLQKFAGIARLYMSDIGRSNLSKLLNDLWFNCTGQGGPANRTVQIGALMEKIQLLLECELNYLPWKPRWLTRWLIRPAR